MTIEDETGVRRGLHRYPSLTSPRPGLLLWSYLSTRVRSLGTPHGQPKSRHLGLFGVAPRSLLETGLTNGALRGGPASTGLLHKRAEAILMLSLLKGKF